MEAQLNVILADMQGCFGEFYFRRFNGKLLVQRRPNRKGHIPSEAQIAARKKFVETYAGYRNVPTGKSKSKQLIVYITHVFRHTRCQKNDVWCDFFIYIVYNILKYKKNYKKMHLNLNFLEETEYHFQKFDIEKN